MGVIRVVLESITAPLLLSCCVTKADVWRKYHTVRKISIQNMNLRVLGHKAISPPQVKALRFATYFASLRHFFQGLLEATSLAAILFAFESRKAHIDALCIILYTQDLSVVSFRERLRDSLTCLFGITLCARGFEGIFGVHVETLATVRAQTIFLATQPYLKYYSKGCSFSQSLLSYATVGNICVVASYVVSFLSESFIISFGVLIQLAFERATRPAQLLCETCNLRRTMLCSEMCKFVCLVLHPKAFILIASMQIYFFSGLSKTGRWFIECEMWQSIVRLSLPLAMLPEGIWRAGKSITQFARIIGWSGAIGELLIACLLLYPASRPMACLLGIGLHFSIQLMQLGFCVHALQVQGIVTFSIILARCTHQEISLQPIITLFIFSIAVKAILSFTGSIDQLQAPKLYSGHSVTPLLVLKPPLAEKLKKSKQFCEIFDADKHRRTKSIFFESESLFISSQSCMLDISEAVHAFLPALPTDSTIFYAGLGAAFGYFNPAGKWYYLDNAESFDDLQNLYCNAGLSFGYSCYDVSFPRSLVVGLAACDNIRAGEAYYIEISPPSWQSCERRVHVWDLSSLKKPIKYLQWIPTTHEQLFCER